MSEIDARLDLALRAALAAEQVILGYYQDPRLKVEIKRDKTVVTDADKNAEKKIREMIADEFGEDGILGEEFGDSDGENDYKWILDPIDGTQSFIAGVPLFGTLIGITKNGAPIAGVVNFPALREVYYARLGTGAWWRPAAYETPIQARVSKVSTWDKALFCTTNAANFEKAGVPDFYNQLFTQAGTSRGWGDCYGHMLVATGRAEVMVDPLMQVWDCAALYPIVTEAGGHFFDLNGRSGINGGSAISSNAALSDDVRRMMNS